MGNICVRLINEKRECLTTLMITVIKEKIKITMRYNLCSLKCKNNKFNIIYNYSKDSKIFRYILTTCARPVCENYTIDKRSQRRCKSTERSTIFMDRKAEHSRDVNYPKLINRFNAIPIKIPTKFSVIHDKLILKCIWKGTGPRMAIIILNKK